MLKERGLEIVEQVVDGICDGSPPGKYTWCCYLWFLKKIEYPHTEQNDLDTTVLFAPSEELVSI